MTYDISHGYADWLESAHGLCWWAHLEPIRSNGFLDIEACDARNVKLIDTLTEWYGTYRECQVGGHRHLGNPEGTWAVSPDNFWFKEQAQLSMFLLRFQNTGA